MSKKWIKNFEQLSTTKGRRMALEIIEAGLDAIETEKVIKDSVKVENNVLTVKDKTYSLEGFKRIKVIGFGKASCQAAVALEKILGSRIKEGAVIDVKTASCKFIKVHQGTHPRPSSQNVSASENIVGLTRDAAEDDLFIVIVSGGGSALLCWPKEECDQSQELYQKFLVTGGTIQELNIVRKHLSYLKGGGLAKLLFPATVLGLIFCDVPGDHHDKVASGPTFKDETTIADADKILKKYNISNNFNLTETPKEDRYFEKVTNISLVSNKDALGAMAKKAETLNQKAKIISSDMYDFPDKLLDKFFLKPYQEKVLLGGGEVRITLTSDKGNGGRNQYLAVAAIKNIKDSDVFVSFASDGIDNSDAAGVVVDKKTKHKIKELGLDVEKSLKDYDSYDFFEKTGDLIFTGPTGANVSDLVLLLNTKE